jgi:hypothetical protein
MLEPSELPTRDNKDFIIHTDRLQRTLTLNEVETPEVWKEYRESLFVGDCVHLVGPVSGWNAVFNVEHVSDEGVQLRWSYGIAREYMMSKAGPKLTTIW